MNERLKRQVRERAGNRCEYCQTHQDDSPLSTLQIEHITPRKHGGSDRLENLALACLECNLHKGSNLAGIDPDSGQVIPLFNPRMDHWDDHFNWSGILIVGKTPTGRATVSVLCMNSDDHLALRSS
jgi:5-methylcytosine-specific restriction endonuclease McrA